jgi:hypothetical protein
LGAISIGRIRRSRGAAITRSRSGTAGCDASPRPRRSGGPLKHALDQRGDSADDAAALEEPKPEQRLDLVFEQFDPHGAFRRVVDEARQALRERGWKESR